MTRKAGAVPRTGGLGWPAEPICGYGARPMSRYVPVAAVTAMNAFLAVIATYALLRAYDVLFKSEPNPATVIWSAHIAMFWRLGVGVYVAGPVALATALAAQRDLAKTLRVSATLLPIVGGLIAVQGALLP
jgi:hypothetical protein